MTTRNPNLIRLPHLDKEKVHRDALEVWQDALKGAAGPEEHALAAATLVNTCQSIIERLRPERDELAVSLALYDGALAMDKVIGVARTRFYELTCQALGITDAERHSKWRANATTEQIIDRAQAHDVAQHPADKAGKRVVKVAHQVAVAEEAAQMGRTVRDRAANELMNEPHNWSRVKVGELIGRNGSRLSHIAAAAAKGA